MNIIRKPLIAVDKNWTFSFTAVKAENL